MGDTEKKSRSGRRKPKQQEEARPAAQPMTEGVDGDAEERARQGVGEQAEPAPTVEDDGAKVICHRFKDQYTLLGPPVIVRPIKEMAAALAGSWFVREWVAEQIEKALRGGHEFVCRSEQLGTPKSIYRLCTDEDIRDLSAKGQLAEALAKPGDYEPRRASVDPGGKPSRRKVKKSRSAYRVPASVGANDAELVAGLQKSGRAILEILRKHVGPNGGVMDGLELKTLLDDKKAKGELVTKMDPVKLFAFHMSQFFKKTDPPLVEYIEDEDGEDGAEDEPEEQEEQQQDE